MAGCRSGWLVDDLTGECTVPAVKIAVQQAQTAVATGGVAMHRNLALEMGLVAFAMVSLASAGLVLLAFLSRRGIRWSILG